MLDEWVHLGRLHRAVALALETELTSQEFMVRIRVHPIGQHPTLASVTELARRVDFWLASLDPDTSDPSRLRTEICEPELLLEIHAIPKDPEDRNRRTHPIVWNPVPFEGPLPPGEGPSAAV